MRTIIIAPHPDDEVLGAGGTLFRRKAEGGKVAWLIVTAISTDLGWTVEKTKQREEEIKRISNLFGFDSVFQLGFPATQLDRVSMSDLVMSISNVFKIYEPNEVMLPTVGCAY